jgi:AbrB family looped-hinge helix DNA binding protein
MKVASKTTGEKSMVVKLSSKGQLVIPQPIREAMGLEPGATFNLRREGDVIILEPVEHRSPIEVLYGKYGGADLLSGLEAEHKQELEAEP